MSEKTETTKPEPRNHIYDALSDVIEDMAYHRRHGLDLPERPVIGGGGAHEGGPLPAMA